MPRNMFCVQCTPLQSFKERVLDRTDYEHLHDAVLFRENKETRPENVLEARRRSCYASNGGSVLWGKATVHVMKLCKQNGVSK